MPRDDGPRTTSNRQLLRQREAKHMENAIVEGAVGASSGTPIAGPPHSLHLLEEAIYAAALTTPDASGTKWKRLEVKRLEEEAGELEADVELAAEELPVAVAELHEKAEKSKEEADIDASNAVTKIYTG